MDIRNPRDTKNIRDTQDIKDNKNIVVKSFFDFLIFWITDRGQTDRQTNIACFQKSVTDRGTDGQTDKRTTD